MLLQPFYYKIAASNYPRILLKSPFFSYARALYTDLYYHTLLATQYFPPKELEKIRRTRLSILLNYAGKHIPFYREILSDIRYPEDFSRIPIITKEKMRQEFEREKCYNSSLMEFGVPAFTSGSTGIPFHFYLDRNMYERNRARYRRMIQWMGRAGDDTVMQLFPRQLVGTEGEGMFYQCIDPPDLERKIKDLYRLFRGKTLILHSRTSHLLRLAQLLRRDKQSFLFRALIGNAEQLYPEVREFMQETFNAPVFDFYGSNEATGMGFECEAHDGFHIQSELVYIEIVNEHGKPIPPGAVGDIVITSFDNLVMPFIRYKIGDRGYMIDDTCRCGRTLPRIKIQGREISSFLRPDGTIGYFASLIHPVASMVEIIKQYQVVRKSKRDFLIKIVPVDVFRKNDGELIIDKMAKYLGPQARLEIELVQKIEYSPSGKERAFINLTPDFRDDL